MIKEKQVREKYNYFIKEAFRLLEKDRFEDACDCAKVACVLAKNYYLCYEDARLEDYISKASIKSGLLLQGPQDRKSNRFVFYDTHTTDNIALTQQYLGALLSWDVELLYLTSKSIDSPKTVFIKEMLESSKKVSVAVIPENLSSLETIKYIVNSVQEYSPCYGFIQTTSDDIAGTIAWKLLEETDRFFIDLSDHSFWIGASVYDYFIEFRNYGVNIAINHRGIQSDKILVQPFYPISKNRNFQGLPGDNGTFKLLSGGRLEKIYGQEDKYFHLIKKILQQNKNAVLYFVGGGAFGKSGESAYILKKWKELGISDRVYMLGFRNDIVEIYKHVDLYIGTFPMGGGLMSQIAATQEVPIVQYASEGLSNYLGEFLLDNNNYRKFVFVDDEDAFLDEVKYLTINEAERVRQGKQLKQAVISKHDFDSQLRQLILSKKDKYKRKRYQVDCDKLRDNQFELENNCHHSYSRILIKSRYLRKQHPFEYCLNILYFLKDCDKRWLINRLLKTRKG